MAIGVPGVAFDTSDRLVAGEGESDAFEDERLFGLGTIREMAKMTKKMIAKPIPSSITQPVRFFGRTGAGGIAGMEDPHE